MTSTTPAGIACAAFIVQVELGLDLDEAWSIALEWYCAALPQPTRAPRCSSCGRHPMAHPSGKSELCPARRAALRQHVSP